MPNSAQCALCSSPLEAADRYCPACGKITGNITWSFSRTQMPEAGPITLRPTEPLFVIARNVGQHTVNISLDARFARGLLLQGNPVAQVPAGQTSVFLLSLVPGQSLSGSLTGRSKDASRDAWWDREKWRDIKLALAGKVILREERWIYGSPVLLFPPGVIRQSFRVWNKSDETRELDCPVPEGYCIRSSGTPIDRSPQQVPAHQALELTVEPLPSGKSNPPDAEWTPDEKTAPIPLVRLPTPPPAIGPDAVIAIDFGTRNTGIRVRWRRTLFTAKPTGSVDIIGDKDQASTASARFPTAMVLHLKDRSFAWGSAAAERIDNNQLKEDEVAVDNLKTYLRANVDHYRQYRDDWTNEALLQRYFEQIFMRLDRYFETLDPGSYVKRQSLNLRYVLTRPVLDTHSGDVIGKTYERALRLAIVRCGIRDDQLVFLPEPVAAAIGISKRREQELLKRDGEAIAIIDSGGGTTDVALARVRLRNGGVTLEIAGSYALQIEPDNPAIAALSFFQQNDHTEFGGNTIDCALAHRLLTNASDLLETEGRAIPTQIHPTGHQFTTPQEEARANREFLTVCRRMKEQFVSSSMIYLNRLSGEARKEGEILPFPNRPELAGVYLYQISVNEYLYGPILSPITARLQEEIHASLASTGPDGFRPSEVRSVFYVGGTDLDASIRERFRVAFPGTSSDFGSEEQIEERLNAVVEGALWAEEQLFLPSPLTLTLVIAEKRLVLISQGEPLRPESLSTPRFETIVVEPGSELETCLEASGGQLKEPMRVAQGFYVNETEIAQEVLLQSKVSRERGATALLRTGSQELSQWQFLLTGAAL